MTAVDLRTAASSKVDIYNVPPQPQEIKPEFVFIEST